MSKRTFILAHETARRRALRAVELAPVGMVVTISEPTKTTERIEADRLRQAKWHKLNPGKSRTMQANKKNKVTLGYAASCLGVRIKDVPVEILEAKAMLIRINRKLKESKNG